MQLVFYHKSTSSNCGYGHVYAFSYLPYLNGMFLCLSNYEEGHDKCVLRLIFIHQKQSHEQLIKTNLVTLINTKKKSGVNKNTSISFISNKLFKVQITPLQSSYWLFEQ